MINSWTLIEWKISYIMLSSNWYQLCENSPILFSKMKFKSWHNSQFIFRFKTGTFESWCWTVCSRFFKFTKDWKLGFLNLVAAGLLNFSQFIKQVEKLDFLMLAYTALPSFPQFTKLLVTMSDDLSQFNDDPGKVKLSRRKSRNQIEQLKP